MIQDLAQNSIAFWPEDPDDGVSEKPIILGMYRNVISIEQNGESINLNYSNVAEFCKALKQCKEPK